MASSNRKAGPPARREAVSEWQGRMRAAFLEGVTETDMAEMVAAIVAKAKGGDLKAAQFICNYVMGNPNVSVKNAVIVSGGPDARTDAGIEPLPTRPTLALPGTEGKFDELARRAANGQPLHDPRDGRRDVG